MNTILQVQVQIPTYFLIVAVTMVAVLHEPRSFAMFLANPRTACLHRKKGRKGGDRPRCQRVIHQSFVIVIEEGCKQQKGRLRLVMMGFQFGSFSLVFPSFFVIFFKYGANSKLFKIQKYYFVGLKHYIM